MSTTTAGISPAGASMCSAGTGRPVTVRTGSIISSTDPDVLALQREQYAADHVVDLHQVPPLLPVPVHAHAGPAERRAHHPRHEAVLVRHPRAVHVGEPQRRGRPPA